MKDINFGWPLYYGISFLVLGVGVLFVLIKTTIEGNFSFNLLLSTLLAAGLLGLIGWVFIKIAYSNKQADEENEALGY